MIHDHFDTAQHKTQANNEENLKLRENVTYIFPILHTFMFPFEALFTTTKRSLMVSLTVIPRKGAPFSILRIVT